LPSGSPASSWTASGKQAVAAIREWYAQHCPRLTKDDVELGVGWVGSALITWDQFQARTRIKDEKDRYRMTPEQAVEMFTATCASRRDPKR
jgi:hypothetical protein